MRQGIYPLLALLALSFLLGVMGGCNKEPTPSLYDPNRQSAAAPLITSIDPPTKALAGVSMLTIKGQNFSPDKQKNFVYFDASPGEVLSASATEIVVRPPNVVGDSIKIKIAVHGAELFSNIVLYKLEYSALDYGGIDKAFDVYGVEVDNQENVYLSLGTGKIIKIDPEQNRSDFVLNAGGSYKGLKFGKGGFLYGVRTRYVYQISPDGATVSQFGAKQAQPLNDLDFDRNGNLFAAGKYGIFCLKPDASSITAANYPLTTLNAIRVFNDYVYVAGDYAGTDVAIPKKAVWRNKILDANGTLGATEIAYDWAAAPGRANQTILALTFAADGDMYIGTDAGDGIVVLHPQGEGNYLNAISEALYPTVLSPPSSYFSWGSGQYLYVNHKSSTEAERKLIRVTMGKESAPYFGRQ